MINFDDIKEGAAPIINLAIIAVIIMAVVEVWFS